MTVDTVVSAAVIGVTGRLVRIEIDVSNGLPGMALIGLPDAAVSEARDRVRAALLNSALPWPAQKVTINLSPAGVHKRGTGFDLALAGGLLLAQRRAPAAAFNGTAMVGELGLDGSVRPVPGIVAAALACRTEGLNRLFVAAADTSRAGLVPGLEVCGVESLRHLLAVLSGGAEPVSPVRTGRVRSPQPDLRDVVGQPEARLALEVAAAGGHHLYLHGPPGAGKTMLAARLPGLLPDLDESAALEVTAIHSAAAAGDSEPGLVDRPPYVAPHHSASTAAIVGGGQSVPRPGAVSLAHCGVLFLDEAPEFRSGVLDALRQPLESGSIALARSGGTLTLPARFQLVMAANPCPCGHFGSMDRICECAPMNVRRYSGRLSGPLLDRVDLQLAVRAVDRAELLGAAEAESTASVVTRVTSARAAAAQRWRQAGWRLNADVPGRELRGRWRPDAAAIEPLYRALDQGRLSARGADRVLRVAWTLADLGGRAAPDRRDVAAALRFRSAAGAVAA